MGGTITLGQRIVVVIALGALAVIVGLHAAGWPSLDPPALGASDVRSTSTYFIVRRTSLVGTLVAPIALTAAWTIVSMWVFRSTTSDGEA